ncbi:hypothetical protein AB0H76_09450 [Nocardia sp. NPDC050712]|uniref:hypothetical protein n=1 Tax=Nocardia sp. NPDC050712 TaxID=3155518 RepID=UPI0033F1934C
MMAGDGAAVLEALAVLSEVRTLIERLPADDPAYPDLLERRLVAAAEALNLGAEERTVQAIGVFPELVMRQIRAISAEFRDDDDEVEREARAANPR